MAQQLRPAMERATGPFQYALSTLAGTECIAHAIQALTDLDPTATVVSIDGIGAFDVVSSPGHVGGFAGRWGVIQHCPSCCSSMGPRLLTCGKTKKALCTPSCKLREGVQGDPLMPALFSLGQHPALQGVRAHLRDGERLFAFLDDVFVVCSPPRVNAIFGLLQHVLFAHSSIRVHHGKTQVWNRGGVVPVGIDVLQAVARVNDPDAIVWRGDHGFV